MSEITREQWLELRYRRLLFMTHGHDITLAYMDDGEMQCHACMMSFRLYDWRREPLDKLEQVAEQIQHEKVVASLAKSAGVKPSELIDHAHASAGIALSDADRARLAEVDKRIEQTHARGLVWLPMEDAESVKTSRPIQHVLLLVPITRWSMNTQRVERVGTRIVEAHWAHGDGDGMMPAFGPGWFQSDGCGGYIEVKHHPLGWLPAPARPTGVHP